MTDDRPTTQLITRERPLFDEARLAIASFLARYSGCDPGSATPPTSGTGSPVATSITLRCSPSAGATWSCGRGCREDAGLARSTVNRRGVYGFAAIDGIIEHPPAEYVRRPKIDTESATLGLDRMELSAFIAQGAAAGPVDHALACLLGLLGRRVSEASGIDIEDLSADRHRTVTVLGKGAKLAVIPMPPRDARALDLVAGDAPRDRYCSPDTATG
jgi:integrase